MPPEIPSARPLAADAPGHNEPADSAGRAGCATVAEMLRHAGSVVAAGPLPDDVDALGLVHSLRAAGRDARVLGGSPVPRNVGFLPGSSRAIHLPGENPGTPDVFGAIDDSVPDRFGPLLPVAGRKGHVLDVDHHASLRTTHEHGISDFATARCGGGRRRAAGPPPGPLPASAAEDVVPAIVVAPVSGGAR